MLNLELSTEQQFQLVVYGKQSQHLSVEQAQEMLLELLRQCMIKDNVIRQLMRDSL